MVYASDLYCNKVHGTNDDQHSTFSMILTGAAILSAAWNAKKAVDLALKEWDMAKKYWQISKNWIDYYYDNYAPGEDKEIDEAMNLTDEPPGYEAAQGRARTSAMLEFRGLLRKPEFQKISCACEIISMEPAHELLHLIQSFPVSGDHTRMGMLVRTAHRAGFSGNQLRRKDARLLVEIGVVRLLINGDSCIIQFPAL